MRTVYRRLAALVGLLLLAILTIVFFAVAFHDGGGPPVLAVKTILVGLRREGAVIVGADRLGRRVNVAGQPSLGGTHIKIVLHPTLPLAVATSGVTELPPTQRSSVKYIQDVMQHLDNSAQLRFRDIAQRVIDEVHPVVARARGGTTDAALRDELQCEFVIALVRADGRTE
ncbi:MAG TPA: hypothetical protein VGB42_12090, partial [Candidatus Thermoplasmatota archaeon]